MLSSDLRGKAWDPASSSDPLLSVGHQAAFGRVEGSGAGVREGLGLRAGLAFASSYIGRHGGRIKTCEQKNASWFSRGWTIYLLCGERLDLRALRAAGLHSETSGIFAVPCAGTNR